MSKAFIKEDDGEDDAPWASDHYEVLSYMMSQRSERHQSQTDLLLADVPHDFQQFFDGVPS